MVETGTDYSGEAGLVRFPRSVDDLRSTTACPACFEPLRSSLVCSQCGLDLDHAVSGLLAGVSARAAGLLAERRSLICRIRHDTRAASTIVRVPPDPATMHVVLPVPSVVAEPGAGSGPPAPPLAGPTPPAPPRPGPVLPASPLPAPPVPGPPLGPAALRRSSVQVLLLVVGISLVSVAAIFFLLYALTTYGIVGRSLVIGTVTVTAFAVASLLRWRRLTATAEGIAVFAVVLVYLDVFAVRANNLFGSGSSDPLLYWGIALVLSSIGFVLWNRVSRLRVANIVAFAVFAPGVGLVAAAVTAPLDDTTRLFAAFLAVSMAGLAHPLADRLSVDGGRRVAERATSFVIACGGLVVSFVAAFFVAPDLDVAVLFALVAVAAVTTVHGTLVARVSTDSELLRGFGPGFGAVGGLALAVGVVAAAYRALPYSVAMGVAAVGTALILLALLVVLLVVARRTPGSADFGVDRAAAIAVALVAAGALLPPLLHAVGLALRVPLESLTRAWRRSAGDSMQVSVDDLVSVAALAAVLALAVWLTAATGAFARFRPVIGWASGVVLLLAVPLLGVGLAVTAAYLLLAATCVAVLLARGRLADVAGRPLAATAIVATALGYSASWASTGIWLAGTLATIALVLVGRRVTVPLGSGDPAPAPWPAAAQAAVFRSGLLALATVLAIVAAAALAHQRGFELGLDSSATAALDPLRAVSLLSVALLGLAAVPQSRRLLSALDRRTLFALGLVSAAVSVPSAWVMLAVVPAARPFLPEPLTSLLLSAATVGALLAWLLPAANTAFRNERVACAIAAAPAAFWVLDSAARLADLAPDIRSLPGLAAALLVAAAGLAIAARRPRAVPRWSLDLGVAVTGVLGLFVTLGSGLEWLSLLVAAVATLLLAVSPDGLVGASGSRRHLGWLALVLATGALWWRLSTASVGAVEAYVLPVAGVLLLVALLAWRVVRSTVSTAAHAAPALIALGGLVVALVPIGVAGASGAPTRAIIVGLVSVVLLVAGSWLQGEDATRRWLDTLAIAGAGGALAAALPRGIVEFSSGSAAGPAADAWVAALFVVLVVTAIGQTRLRGTDPEARAVTARVVVLAAMAIVFLFELAGIGHPLLGAPRAVGVVLLFSAVFLLAAVYDRPPLGRLVGWAALGLSVATALVGLRVGLVEPIELLTLPIALALLAAGGILLARDPARGSWPALGPGLAVLLLPPLLMADGERPVWRLVAVGVVALLVFALGVRLRLQAPVLVGAVVVLVHAATTFAPQIRAVYELTEWWVWAGVGGIPIIVYAALAERSVRTTRSFVLTIGSLR